MSSPLYTYYSDVETGGQHKVDIYVPNNTPVPEGGYPVIFFIHGGAWMIGSKSIYKEPCQSLAANGYVCVSTDYSLSSLNSSQIGFFLNFFILFMLCLAVVSVLVIQIVMILVFSMITIIFALILWTCSEKPTIQHPTHVLDVANSLKWTLANCAQYQGNSNRLHVMSHSAGAHLGSLLCTNTNYLTSLDVPPNSIKSCIAISGVYSDKRLQETKAGQELLKTVFGKRAHYYDAFPIYNITPETPPFLLLNAGLDFSLKKHSYDFHYALRQSGVYVETAYFPDCNHWNICQGWNAENSDIMTKVDQFISDVEQR